MKKTIVNPHWTNNARTILSAEFHYDDGKVMKATISNSEQNNPDWIEIMSKFSKEEIEANTLKAIEKQNRDRIVKEQKEKALQQRKYHETLYEMKVKAFEVEAVKNSTNRALKSKIRKAKNDFEVIAFTAALLMRESELEEAQAAQDSN